jgi:3D (Asp-Asp-Asp) domain-containing protein
MLLSTSLQRKVVATCGAALGFALLFETTVFDLGKPVEVPITPASVTEAPAAQALKFRATAYCKGTTTASGATVRTGIAAADPELLPVGSVVRIDSLGPKYNGVYTIMDTGPKVQGRTIDLYMWSCHEALAFGSQPAELSVLRLGWNPGHSQPATVTTLFRRREASRDVRRTALRAQEALAADAPEDAPEAGAADEAPLVETPADSVSEPDAR